MWKLIKERPDICRRKMDVERELIKIKRIKWTYPHGNTVSVTGDNRKSN